MKLRRVLPLIGVAWAIVVVAGLASMGRYQDTPGIAATPSVEWPKGTHLRPATDRDTLVLLAHPQCPCTRATIGELNGIMAECEGKMTVYVLFLKPSGFAADWAKTGLWRSAAAIPGVNVRLDDGGVEAARFHGQTSGQTLLFDSRGHLLFSGGITDGRGHSGDNAGRDAIVSLLLTGKSERTTTPVFGCSLRDSMPDGTSK